MEKIGEKYLPVGTVVMLKGGTKRVMIVGFCVVSESDKNKIWDYSGALYPEGLLDSKEICLFDHEQIEEVYHVGLVDEEEKDFKEKLVNLVKDLNEKNKDI